jgi:TPR repeat protein
MYRQGKGAPKDYKTAVKWYTLAAKQGNAESQYNLGLMYQKGLSVPQDNETALEWYTLAAKQGYARAQLNLGLMYAKGEGVPQGDDVSQDDENALKWWKLAAKQGNADAQYILGTLYDNGQGVSQDYEIALKWYILAAKQGNADAQNNLKILEKKISRIKNPQKKISRIKNTPTVTAKNSLPSSSGSVEKENERLRKRIAELEGQKKSKPETGVSLAKKIQKALLVLGLYSGKLDGTIGVRTRSAIRGWQKRNGYPETGKITETQIGKLKQDASQYFSK